ncbi:MAG: triose-phosphate isomerase [Alphaproteobacteria bacterium]|nr:triose-phosphate isomerase [Alphaproteobacteria bacterium]
MGREGRRALIAGNWKMNGLAENGLALARAVSAGATPDIDLLVCPPATLLVPIAEALKGGPVAVGGQDCHAEQEGAHTGDLSAKMLADAGASHVILGHSERRQDHGESDRMVRAKLTAAHDAGLAAIVCVGETLAEREAGETLRILSTQLENSLEPSAAGAPPLTAANTAIAYEPVWAIGSGLTPTPDEVGAAHAHMRGYLETLIGSQAAGMRLLYGGSVNPANAVELMNIDNVDGALVGGASLKAEDFLAIAAGVG